MKYIVNIIFFGVIITGITACSTARLPNTHNEYIEIMSGGKFGTYSKVVMIDADFDKAILNVEKQLNNCINKYEIKEKSGFRMKVVATHKIRGVVKRVGSEKAQVTIQHYSSNSKYRRPDEGVILYAGNITKISSGKIKLHSATQINTTENHKAVKGWAGGNTTQCYGLLP